MVQLQGLVMNPSETGNFISPKKNNQNSGFRIKFQWVAGWVMCILLVFALQRAIIKDLWGHSLRSGEMQYKKPSFTQTYTPGRQYLVKYVRLRQICALVLSIYITTFRLSISFLIRKQIQNNCTLFVYLLYTSDQYVRVQISPLIFIFLCTDTE